MLIRLSTQYGANGTQTVNILNPGNLNHPFEVRGEDSVLDKPAGQFGPLIRVAAVDGKTRLGVLVLGILQVTGHFLVCATCKTWSLGHGKGDIFKRLVGCFTDIRKLYMSPG